MGRSGGAHLYLSYSGAGDWMTATSRLLRVIADFRQQLLDREAQAAATMDRYYQHTIASYINPQLSKLYDQIQQLYDDNPDMTTEGIPIETLNEYISLKTIKELISGHIDQFGALALQQTKILQNFGLNLGIESAQQMLGALIPASIKGSFGVPSKKAIESLVGATQSGSPLADLFNGFGAEAADKVAKTLVNGVTAGLNPRVIAKGVQDALGISRARALTISRQESLRCYRTANLMTFRENSDVVGKWRWSCSKSPRTCIVCLAMDGKEFPLDEEFESHIQCRCAPIPVTKSFDEILSQLGIDASDIPETSMSAANIQTGAEWFEEQSDEVKQQIIGSKAAYDLYASGKVSLHDFVKYDYSDDWGGSRTQKSLKELMN